MTMICTPDFNPRKPAILRLELCIPDYCSLRGEKDLQFLSGGSMCAVRVLGAAVRTVIGPGVSRGVETRPGPRRDPSFPSGSFSVWRKSLSLSGTEIFGASEGW